MLDISAASDKISGDLKGLKNQLPGGKIPRAASFAELKGKLPNPKTLKAVFQPGASIPKEFLKELDPTTDLVSRLGIPPVNLDIPEIKFKPKEPKIEPEVNTEGLTDNEIEVAKAKRAARQKLNNKAAEVQNNLKKKAAGAVGNLTGGIQDKVQGAVQGAVAGAISASPLGGILMRVAAFKFFKSQISHVQGMIGDLKADLDKNLKEGGKDVLKGMTNMKKIVTENKAKQVKLKAAKEAAAAKADAAKAAEAVPADVKGAGQISPSITEKKEATKAKFESFKNNLTQTAENVGQVLGEVMTILKGIMKIVLSLIAAIMAIIAFIIFLIQLLAMLMMMFLKKDSKTNSGGNNAPGAQTPEQFLSDIGYPGYGVEDFDTVLQEVTNNVNNINIPTNPSANIPSTTTTTSTTTGEEVGNITGVSGVGTTTTSTLITEEDLTGTGGTGIVTETGEIETETRTGIGTQEIRGNEGLISTLPLEDLTEPLIIGSTQIGNPLTLSDLDPNVSGKTFSNHPIMGDISDIHPQFINELYNDGILTTEDPTKALEDINPNNWSNQLEKYYENLLYEFADANQMEYIEHLYNLRSELVGYRRYRA